MKILEQLSKEFFVKDGKIYGDEQEIKNFLSQFGNVILGKAKGHKSIEAQSDYTLTIEEDLYRRDFCLNAMAIGKDLVLIDPYGGMEDIKDCLISCVNEEVFLDDPLRIMRALQFASRFLFNLDDITFSLIEKNKHLIKEITFERIFIEFNKPFEKDGDIQLFVYLLDKTGIFEEIFGKKFHAERLNYTTMLSELLFFGIQDETLFNVNDFYRKLYDNFTIKLSNEIKAFDIVYGKLDGNMFKTIFNALKHSEVILESEHIPENFRIPFIDGELPKSRKDVAINGNDLIKMGFKEGKITGDILNFCFNQIFSRKVKNNKADLEALIRNNYLSL